MKWVRMLAVAVITSAATAAYGQKDAPAAAAPLDRRITDVSQPQQAGPSDLVFLDKPKYADALAQAAKDMDLFSVVAPFPRNHRMESDPAFLLKLREALAAYEKARAGKFK